jgi:hypothetical protein
LASLLILAGCGSSGSARNTLAGGNSHGTGGIDPSNSGSVQLRIGDDPATPDGRIVALRLDIASMTLWNSTTLDSISFLSGPISVELTHNSTITVPISESGANPNTQYDRLNITYSGAAISYMDVPSMTIYEQDLGALPNQTVDLSAAPVILASAPVVINVQVNVPSVATLPPIVAPLVAYSRAARPAWRHVTLPPLRRNSQDPKSGVKAIAHALTANSPSVTVSQSNIPQGKEQPENGQVQRFIGTVTNVAGSSITVKQQGNSCFTFSTDGNTNFSNVTLSTALNAVVEVNGSTQADGSLYADEVELVDVANGIELTGLVTSAYPDTVLSLLVQDGIGAGMTNSLIGKSITGQLDQASYTVSTGNLDMGGVTAVFDGEHIFPGQQVEIESFNSLQPDPDGTAGMTVPFMVELRQQTVSGTAVNYVSGGPGVGSFDLNLPQDGSSPLANMNPGLVAVHVLQTTTTYPVLSTINPNAQVQVRGLLLCENDNLNQPCTSFVMVAAKITVNN